jgi:hypothetical protein
MKTSPTPVDHPWFKRGNALPRALTGFMIRPAEPALGTGAELAGFSTDGLVPEQMTTRPPASPEEALLLAVLDDAMSCASLYPPSVQTLADREWLASDRIHPFSARWVCDHLGIDVTFIRAVVRARQAA